MLNTFAAATLHISQKPDTIFTVYGFDVTNSHLLGVLGLAVLIWLLIWTAQVARGKAKANFATRLLTWTFEGLYRTVESIIPDKKWARRIAPLSMTIFFFVVAQYWMGLLPIVGPITGGPEHAPIFRGGVADLNMTFALAIVTIVAAQLYAIKYLGVRGNLRRYFVNPLKDPIMSFVGILEIIAELSRLLGLSFRLFGNVLAGEILLVLIAYLTGWLAPVALQPFYIFELFIGGIQAYIFFMLTTVFISLGLSHHGDTDSAHSSPDTVTAKAEA